MRRNLTMTALASSAVIGFAVLGTAIPAQADDTPSEPSIESPSQPTSAPLTNPTDLTVKSVAQGKGVLQAADEGPGVRNLQVRLTQIGIPTVISGLYTANTADSVEHFKWKNFMDPEDPVLNQKAAKKLLQLSSKGANIPGVCTSAKKIVCVDTKQKTLRLFKNGKQVGAPVDARFGAPGERTREGNFKIHYRDADDVSSQYGTPMPYAAYFSGGQAIHYSMFFNATGYNGASHGCINIGSKAAAKRIFNFAKIGTQVKIYH